MNFIIRMLRRGLADYFASGGGLLAKAVAEAVDPDSGDRYERAANRVARDARIFSARIRLKSGSQEVTVQAANSLRAKDMLEAQYGQGCIMSGPVEVQD